MQLNSPLYTIGTLDAPLWQGNARDDYGCDWIVESEAGWSSSPPARPSKTDKTTGDGTLASTGYYSGRLVTLSGRCVAPDQVSMLWAKARIKAAVKPRNLVQLRVDEMHLSRFAQVRLDDQVDSQDQGDIAFKWQFGVFAPDPRLYSVDSRSLSCGLPTEAGTGRTYPRGYPLVYGGGGEGADGAVVFDQQGDYDTAPAVITVTGPVINPVIEHAESGSQLAFALTVAYGQSLAVDLATQSAVLQGAPVQGLLSPASAWWMLVPGVNQVAFRGQAGTMPDGSPGSPRMTLTASSAWS